VLIAVERHGSVRSVPVKNDSIAELKPVVNAFVRLEAYLIETFENLISFPILHFRENF
jgi:hypothetical protein